MTERIEAYMLTLCRMAEELNANLDIVALPQEGEE